MVQAEILHNVNLRHYNKLLNLNTDSGLALKLYILFDYNYLLYKLKLPRYIKQIIKLYDKFKYEPLIYCAYKNNEEFQNDIIIIKHIVLNKPLFKPILGPFPKFPVQFQDLPQEVPYVSKWLNSCEKWWVLNNFKKSKAECLQYILTLQ